MSAQEREGLAAAAVAFYYCLLLFAAMGACRNLDRLADTLESTVHLERLKSLAEH